MLAHNPLSKSYRPPAGPRSRVFYLNDLAGDLDGLFATVHAILSNTIELRGIAGTGSGRYEVGDETIEKSVSLGHEMLRLMGLDRQIPLHGGAKTFLESTERPDRSEAVEPLIAEARRPDTELPLFVAVGGGLPLPARRPSIQWQFPKVTIDGSVMYCRSDAAYLLARCMDSRNSLLSRSITMTFSRLSPSQMVDTRPNGYAQATWAQSPANTLYMSGQLGLSDSGPNDFVTQMDRAFEGLRVLLQEVGGAPSDIAKITLLIVDHDAEKLQQVCAKRRAFFGSHLPASVLIPVTVLALPGALFEVDATAIVDRK